MRFINTPSLKSRRLILRRFERQDIEAVYTIFSDKEVNTFLPMFPLNTLDQANDYLTTILNSYKRPQGYRYAICLKEENIPIGYVNASIHHAHDFGYGLRKEFWHQGIVSEAASCVIEQLRKDHIPFITATHDIKNPRSGHVMKRIGMTYQYSYEEMWMPKNIQVTFRMYQLNLDHKERVYMEYWNHSDVHYIENL